MHKQRLEILKQYKEDVWKFTKFNVLAIITYLFFFFFVVGNPLKLTLWPFLLCVMVLFYMMIQLFLKHYNRNILLFVASLLIWVYIITFDSFHLEFAFFFVFFSALYELGMRFGLGMEIRFKIKKLSWYVEPKENKK